MCLVTNQMNREDDSKFWGHKFQRNQKVFLFACTFLPQQRMFGERDARCFCVCGHFNIKRVQVIREVVFGQIWFHGRFVDVIVMPLL